MKWTKVIAGLYTAIGESGQVYDAVSTGSGSGTYWLLYINSEKPGLVYFSLTAAKAAAEHREAEKLAGHKIGGLTHGMPLKEKEMVH